MELLFHTDFEKCFLFCSLQVIAGTADTFDNVIVHIGITTLVNIILTSIRNGVPDEFEFTRELILNNLHFRRWIAIICITNPEVV